MFGDLHKLRVLNFDSGDTKESRVFEGDISKLSYLYNQNIKKNLKCSTNRFIGKCAKWVKTKSLSETSFKEESSRKIKNRISSIFKRQSNQSKRPLTKRSVSLYNLKQNFSSTNFLVTKPIKRTLKTMTGKSLKRKQDKHDHYNKTDVHVLFMSETRNGGRRLKKHNIPDDKRKLDLRNNSKLSNLFSYKSNLQYDNYNGNKNNNKFLKNYNHQNDYEFKQYKNYIADTGRINDHTSSLKSKPHRYTMPMHYNLVDFSCTACKVETPYNECIHKISTIDPCPYLNKQVWVTTPCLDLCRDISKPNLNINNKTETREDECCKPCMSKQKEDLPLLSPISTYPESLAKLTLKYVLFVVAIIVWSPCILLICIYWMVTYSVRPLNILEKINIFAGNKCGIQFDLIGHRNCCQPILNLLDKISEQVNYTLKTICNLMKKQKPEESPQLKPCIFTSSSNKRCYTKNGQKLCPNPKIKYALYYNRQRGWIMKPLKKRRPSHNKRSECNIYEYPSSKENNQKKVMRDQYSECSPENLEDKTGSKTIKTLSGRPSMKKIIQKKVHHPSVSKDDSQKISSLPNISDNMPSKISRKDASTMPLPLNTDTQVSSDLISNKDYDHKQFRNRSSERYPGSFSKNLRKKPQRNVSFEGNVPECMDLSDPRNAQIMLPRMNVQTPFYPDTSNKEYCFPLEPFDRIIKGRNPCMCHPIKRVPTVKLKRPIKCKEKRVSPKYIRSKTCEKACHLNIRPKISNLGMNLYRKYEGKGKKVTRRGKVYCWCKSARKNVNEIIHDVECEVWKCNYCEDMYIHTLRRKPWFWVYKRCPGFYPYFLIFYKFYENVIIGLMFIISVCVWVPILCWCYLCFSLFCRWSRC